MSISTAPGRGRAIMQSRRDLFFGGDRIIRVFGKVGDSDKEFELILSDHKLQSGDAHLCPQHRAAVAAGLGDHRQPGLRGDPRLDDPADPQPPQCDADLCRRSRTIPDSIVRVTARKDELGVTERELAGMQTQLQRILGEQKHLADLGLAVSKINHDMRNILASAQLISDRLRLVKDPTVQIFAPKLLRALDRAVAYSEGVLAYGRTQEPAPVRRRLRLRQLVEEVQGMLGLDASTGIEFENLVDAGFEVDADSEQLFRVLTNLCRNAMQAMSVRQRERAGAPPHDLGRAHRRRLLDLRHRHRPRPAAEGAREPVLRLPRLGAQRRHRPRPGHRRRAGARPWRHHPPGRERQRPHGLFDHHPRPPGQARRSAPGLAPAGLTRSLAVHWALANACRHGEVFDRPGLLFRISIAR